LDSIARTQQASYPAGPFAITPEVGAFFPLHRHGNRAGRLGDEVQEDGSACPHPRFLSSGEKTLSVIKRARKPNAL
jgi:hypothetical protein